MNESNRMPAKRFLAIAVIEHHLQAPEGLSVYDVAGRLAEVWLDVRRAALSGEFTARPDCIQALNSRIAFALQVAAGDFKDHTGWSEFVAMCGSVEEAPGQVLSWYFSNLYWNQLTRLKLATSWLYMNARRVQLNLPELDLRLGSLGMFLESLSGSGPPIFDGQTFSPEDFADAA